MCFAVLSVASLVAAVVSVQLLRLGLFHQNVNDDQTSQQQGPSDAVMLVALVTTASECVLCIISSVISCRLAKAAKDELQRKREGTYQMDEYEKGMMAVSKQERRDAVAVPGEDEWMRGLTSY